MHNLSDHPTLCTYAKVILQMNFSKYVTLGCFFCCVQQKSKRTFYCNSGDIFHPKLSLLGDIFNIYASQDANSHLFMLPVEDFPKWINIRGIRFHPFTVQTLILLPFPFQLHPPYRLSNPFSPFPLWLWFSRAGISLQRCAQVILAFFNGMFQLCVWRR